MKPVAHAITGGLATLTIATFLTSTVYTELFGSKEQITAVKNAIVFPGLAILIPLMAATGGLGRALVGGEVSPAATIKMRRMKTIALLGLFILVPCALLLAYLARNGLIGPAFTGIQLVEVAAGATNLTLMCKNFRLGLALSGRFRSNRHQHAPAE